MANSNLIRASIVTANSSPRTERIAKFTPHYMAGNMSAESCARMFQSRGRNASANYCIGSDGGIVLNVPESRRAWTSSSAWNDQRAVTVEVANDRPDGHVTQAAWDSLVALAADVCRRNGFRLRWTGDRSGSLTAHYFYSDTSCPGEYLRARMGQLAAEVNARLDGQGPKPGGVNRPGKGRPEVATIPDKVYRAYNPSNGDHLLAGKGEYDKLVKAGWRGEGEAFGAATGMVPVYRLYNPNSGEHFYTTSNSEANHLVDVGWAYEGIGFYGVASGGVPIHRLCNPNAKPTQSAHVFTRSDGERKSLMDAGWRYEGVAWRAAS